MSRKEKMRCADSLEYYLAVKKERSHGICRTMDRIRTVMSQNDQYCFVCCMESTGSRARGVNTEGG